MNLDVLNKIYAGLLGMDAGMRLGAPVENPYWTYEQLRDHYGDIRGYLRVHRTHTADDDVNGPILLVRALEDAGFPDEFTPKMAGEAWLNYTRFGRGMFWWGGEEVSTEHRAYMNLRRGLAAPESGSSETNGIVASEQIGGQIFIDTWGLICPGNPAAAAKYASAMASVSHDGNGIYGGMFMAACVAAAFTASSVDEIIDAGLAQIPEDSDYAAVVRAVRAFHAEHPDDFRAARDYVEKEWGHDRFPGGWHIIPNAGICLVGLLYGGGDLGRSIEIAVMSGFDTDCNASNIGTILGVFGGLDGVPTRYREPIGDGVVLSGISGYLNIVDLPSLARELYGTACHIAGEEPEIAIPKRGELHFDFELPGATHGLALTDRASHSLRNVTGEAYTGERCLELMIDGKRPGPADLFFKACYLRADLDDERYEPVFSPRIYPGQEVVCAMKSVQGAPAKVTVTPFVTRAMSGDRIELESTVLPEGEWTEIRFVVPDLLGDQAHDIGWNFAVAPDEDPWAFGKVYIDEIRVAGAMDYSIDFSIQREEFGQITPFSFSDCKGSVEGGALRLAMEYEPTAFGCQAYTGNYYLRDTSVEVTTVIEEGESALILLRAQGARRYMALGLAGEGKAVIRRVEAGKWTDLASAGFVWERGSEMLLRAEADGDKFILSIDGKEILSAQDNRLAYGMIGFGMSAIGVTTWRDPHIRGDV